MKPSKDTLCRALLVIGYGLFIVGIFGMFGAFQKHHSEPPPEFTIVCDGNGHFGAMFTNIGHYVIDDNYNHDPLLTRKEAISRAWGHHNWELKQPKDTLKTTYNWHDCDK